MKKILLSLLIFCSVISQAQIQIPQVVGLPSALNLKVDKVTGKSLVADTSIVKLTGVQAGAQVNKIEGVQKNGVDLPITGKKVNITVPTTAAEIGAQPAGTYATGTGTAYNSNTGDETLTSIKTKLGAASAVSDGYLKYQDYVKFDGKLSSEVDGSTTNELQTISTNGAAGNITLSNSGGTLNLNVNDADASPTNEIQDLSLSGNMLTLSSDAPVDVSQATAVQANTAKVSNANHTGDVIGSTALTLATVNSSVGTFNNVTINAKGLATAGSNVSYEPSFSKNTGFNKNFGTTTGTVLEGRTFGTAANSAVGDFINRSGGLTNNLNNSYNYNGTNWWSETSVGSPVNYGVLLNISDAGKNWNNQLAFGINNNIYFRQSINSSDFGSTVWNNIYHSGNLTNTLTTNYIPKWDGSNFVNATAGTDYQLPITLTTTGTSGAATFSGNVLNVPNYGNGATSGTYVPALTNYSNIASSSAFEAMYMHIGNMYSLSIKAAITPSTAGSCTLRITLPQQSNNKTGVFSVTSISNDQSTVLPSFTYTVGGADYVGVVVNVPSTDPITLTVTGMYTHQ